MAFVSVHNFSNYVDAHIVLGNLASAGIDAWLKDEHTVSTNPLWTNAVGGIKLMVAEADREQAETLLSVLQSERKSRMRCPNCKGHNVEQVTTPRKLRNVISAILSFSLVSFAVAPYQVYHCFDCNAEFKEPLKNETAVDNDMNDLVKPE